jgi:regulator of replication initiation timing
MSSPDRNWLCERCTTTITSAESNNQQDNIRLSPPANNRNNLIDATGNMDHTAIMDKLNQILQHQQRTDSSINSMKEMLENYELTLQNLTKENAELHFENQNLRKRIDHCEDAVNRMNQINLNHNMEICGIDEQTDENLITILKDVSQFYGTQIESTDVFEIRRKRFNRNPNNGLPPPIVVKFYNKQKRDQILERSRTKKLQKKMLRNFNTGNTNEANQSQGQRFIYLNEQLTNVNKFIFKKVRDLRRNKKVEQHGFETVIFFIK